MNFRQPLILLLLLTMLVIPVASHAQDDPVEKTLFVSTETVNCAGDDAPPCLLVREDPEETFAVLEGIANFDHIEGLAYELTVLETTDGDDTIYELVSIDDVEASEDVLENPLDNEQTYFVGAETVECVGVGPQTCLLVSTNLEQGYSLFYDTIIGFEYEEGYEYELRVIEQEIPNPPEDASSIRYLLVEEVSKTDAADDNQDDTDATEDDDATETPSDEDSDSDLNEFGTAIELSDEITLQDPTTFDFQGIELAISPPQEYAIESIGSDFIIVIIGEDTRTIDQYFNNPNTIGDPILIYTVLPLDAVESAGFGDYSLAELVEELLRDESELLEVEDIIINERPAITYTYKFERVLKEGIIVMVEYEDHYLLIQGSASRDLWSEFEATFFQIIGTMELID